MVESHFHVQLTAILDVLMKTAVSDICALADNWVQALQMEIRKSHKENEFLRQKLHRMELQKPPAETQTDKSSCRTAEVDPGRELRCDSKKMVENSGTESATSKRGQWCVMLQKWNPVLEGAKAEAMDRSISETQENLDVLSGDVDYTPVSTDTDANQQFYEPKTESENALPGFQKSEGSLVVSAGCEDKHAEPIVLDEESETESPQHIPEPKREEEEEEEEEEFDIYRLLTPDLQLNTANLLRECHSESTNSDCRVPLNLDKDFSLSMAVPNVTADFSERGSMSLTQEKQTGTTFICNICGKTLTTKRSFISHLRLHTGEKPFTCTQCGKRFAKKFNLDIHYNVHSGARPYACTLCPRSFADPSAFGRHKMMHRKKTQTDSYGPKCKFMCNVCGLRFFSKTSLAVHSKLHTAEKQHSVEKVLFRNVHSDFT